MLRTRKGKCKGLLNPISTRNEDTIMDGKSEREREREKTK
jgi:hypothetical protein